MKTDLKLLLDDIINQVIYINEQDTSFQVVFTLTKNRIRIKTTGNDEWGYSASLNNHRELTDAWKFLKEQFQKHSQHRITYKYGGLKEDNEHLKDLEDDIKRGIK